MAFPKIEGYVVTEKLGAGSYSTVYKAYTKVGSRQVYAIKCVPRSLVKHSHSAVDKLVTEIRVLNTLSHRHVVNMSQFTWDDKYIYIIMEYCCGGDLSRYIRKYGRIPENQVLYFLQQLASALQFLREKGIAHMDLKPQNLLLQKEPSGKYILKVADFGFAQYMSEDTIKSSIRGSPLYMAPEMLTQDGRGAYTANVDLWSVGVIMYECLFGRAPYSSSTFKELMDKILTRAPIEIPANASISASCRALLEGLLQHDPSTRLRYDEFFAHPYLDLEHMPTKENYDKAVSLITEAISADRAGRLPAALDAYRAGLRYLVPQLSVHAPPAHRALRAKIYRYMERAEEIKETLKCSSVPSPSPCPSPAQREVCLPRATPPPAPRHAHFTSCCAGARSDSSVHFTEQQSPDTGSSYSGACNPSLRNYLNGSQPSAHALPAEVQTVAEQTVAEQAVAEHAVAEQAVAEQAVAEQAVAEQTVAEQTNGEDDGEKQKAAGARRFELKRLFKRNKQEPVPFLTSDDIVEDTAAPRAVQPPLAETAADICKIS